MSDVEALIRVGVQSPGLRKVAIAETRKPSPTHPLIAAPCERVPPEATQPVAKELKTVQVSRYGMVVVEARDDTL